MLIKSNLYKFIQENKNENIKDLLKNEYGLQIIDYPNDKLYIVKTRPMPSTIIKNGGLVFGSVYLAIYCSNIISILLL